MTNEEKDLALKLYDRMMVGIFNLSESDIIAKDCVKAARSIYQAIDSVEQQEIEDEKAIKEQEIADAKARKEQLKQEREANKKDARWFIIYHKQNYGYGDIRYFCSICHTTQNPLRNYLRQYFSSSYNNEEVGIYEITKEEADNLLDEFNAHALNNKKELICNSRDDFYKYVKMCPSAKDVDMTGIKIKAYDVVCSSILDAIKNR